VDAFVGESVAVCPIRTLRARLAIRIINAFLMWASENAIGGNDRAHLMLAEKIRDLIANERIEADVGSF
jgi:hypothetical protein